MFFMNLTTNLLSGINYLVNCCWCLLAHQCWDDAYFTQQCCLICFIWPFIAPLLTAFRHTSLRLCHQCQSVSWILTSPQVQRFSSTHSPCFVMFFLCELWGPAWAIGSYSRCPPAGELEFPKSSSLKPCEWLDEKRWTWGPLTFCKAAMELATETKCGALMYDVSRF